MKIAEIDKGLCIGCGTCASLCPECFELGEDGKAHFKGGKDCKCNLEDVADNCPAQAITIKNPKS